MGNRSTIIFGNGVGMALDPDYFQLKTGLKTVWDNSNLLSVSHKKLIQSALPSTIEEAYPDAEESLGKLQDAISAAQLLKEFDNEDISWLNDHSRDVIFAFKKYIHQVGIYFQSSGYTLPQNFVDALSIFINQTKSHIAVLNYDNLLYDALCRNHTLSGYSGDLLDGFRRDGFNPSFMDRVDINRFGFYLNLHGSPLFVGNKKMYSAGRDFLEANAESHIVLTHISHKISIIKSSHILNEYWSRLVTAFNESDSIILFGYSGLDSHLNALIGKYSKKRRIIVIEWGNDESTKRSDYWNETLYFPSELNVIPLTNILEFEDWKNY